MGTLQVKIGEHRLQIECCSEKVMKMFQKNFSPLNEICEVRADISIRIDDGYGGPFVDYQVEILKQSGQISFRRADYLIEADLAYTTANIFVFDELALKHALINLYSSHIVHHNWGLLIHSSCVIDQDVAHIFAGHSGAGKSTAARLSQPRQLLSDEATVIKINPETATVYNSPFRSELEVTEGEDCCPLASIQLLYHSLHNQRTVIRKSNALLQLMDKVFYWHHDPEDTGRALGMLNKLVNIVPIYELHFQKNNTFWELIS